MTKRSLSIGSIAFQRRLSAKEVKKQSKILVADDVRVNRMLIKRLLEKLGHLVVLAQDGREALNLLYKDEFDLVLLDMYMPELDGDEVLRIIMSNKELQNIPVIMISASEEMNNIVKCIDLGAADYLPKPFDPSLFKARVNACLTWNRKTFRRIEQEKNRADHLLSVIYPEAVVTELKETQEVLPRRHDGVAVLFLDIAGFTSYCHERPAEEVVNKLHDLFCLFEDIAEKHKVDKTKTIGDAFMATSGLLQEVTNPVRNCVACGLDMIEAARTSSPWSVRVGIHVGPVVAGVVGRKHSLFDVWGNTVNTASRVESHGVVNGVNVSKSAMEKLKGQCRYEYLGEFDAKGLGLIEMHNVLELIDPDKVSTVESNE